MSFHKISCAGRNNVKKNNLKQICFFLFIAFLSPFVCVILTMSTTLGHSDVFSLLIFGVEASAPSLAAILTVLHFESGHGLRQFLKRCYADHIHFHMLLISLFLPVVIIGVPKLFYWLSFGITPTFGSLSAQKILIVCWALIAEELGWRGFLQDKLSRYLNKLILPLILGIIWAAWHYHFFISGRMAAPSILFILGCITDSYLYFAVTKMAKGNIIPVSILHFSENLCFNLFLINPENNNGSSVPYLLYTISSLIAAAIAFSVMLRRRGKT